MEHLAGPVASGRIDVVDMPEVRISSTQVRERLQQGRDITGLVPPAVAAMLAPATSA